MIRKRTIFKKEAGVYHFNAPGCLEFVAESNGIKVEFTKNATEGDMYFSIDGGTDWYKTTEVEMPFIDKGETVKFIGDLTPVNGLTEECGIGRFSLSNVFTPRGNVMSLLFLDNFSNKVSLENHPYAFVRLFYDCQSIKDIEYLQLPATTLGNYCYADMFHNVCCTFIPSNFLPATTLKYGCYHYMFSNCALITTVPSDLLPSTTLARGCYMGMFKGCAQLKKAPVLPATALVQECYELMFGYCSKLNYIKAMFTTKPSTTYTRNWVTNVANSGTFVKNSAATWTDTFSANAIPKNSTYQWTVTTASS